MSTPTPDSLVVSIHVPKTGGTTLGVVLERLFGSQLQRAYETEDAPRIQSPKCVHGHAVLPAFRELIDAAPATRWLTFLRDPLAGAISHYHFTVKQWASGPNAHFEDRGLEHWLTHDEPYRWPDPPGYRHDRYSIWLQEIGKDLDAFDFVGLTELFDRSMFQLYETFGWKPIRYRATNRGRYTPPELPAEVIDRFRELNAADEALVAEVRRRLEAREQELGPEFQKRQAAFLASLEAPAWQFWRR